MANDKKVNIGIGFNVDRSGLNSLRTELNSLQNMTTDDLVKIGSEDAVRDLQEIKKAAGAVQEALEKSFNPKLNTQDLTKFQQELKLSGQSIASIKAGLDKAGASGQNAFRNITAELLTTNRQMKQTSQWLNKMADTMANSVRWTIASTALNAVTGSIQKAYSFTKQLDSSLNDIRIVTGKSADEMARFAKEATTAAKNLGSTTTAYTKAALIYEQQGLGTADVAARSDVTTKVSNVTGQGADEVSEQLTAIWNGYKVSAAEAELYIDKVSAVAATTAADLEELSQGMGKVASAANAMGVDIDQLNASLATIISVTRQDANAVGTSLKTIYARMGDLMVDGEDEFGVKLGDVSSKLKTMGIDVLDAQGQMRDMGEVIEEVASKWDTWTEAQQQAAAVALAGKRQYNNLIALFENWDMYEEAKSTSKGGAGELQKQQDIYMESMEAHLNQLKTETEDLYQTLLDPEGLNPMIDVLTTLVGLVNNMIQSLGGGADLLNTLGAIGLNVFSKQITRGVTTAINNVTGFRENLKQAVAEANIIKELELTDLTDARQAKLLELGKKRLEIADSLSDEEYNMASSLIKQTNELYKQQDALDENREDIQKIYETLTGEKIDLFDADGFLKDAEEITKTFAKEENWQITDFTGLSDSIDQMFGAAQANITAKNRLRGVEGNISFNEGVAADAYQTQNIQSMGGANPPGENDIWEDAKFSENAAIEAANAQREKLAELNLKVAETEGMVSAANADNAQQIVAVIADMENLNEANTLSIEEQEELAKALEMVKKAFDSNGNVIAQTSKGLDDARRGFKVFEKAAQSQQKQINAAKKAIKNYNKELKQVKEETKNAEANLDKLKQSFDLTKSIQNITDLAGGVANLLTSLNSLKNVGSIINDETLTNGEKATQLITIAATALPMLISGLQTTKTALIGLAAPITAKALAISLDTLATKGNTDAAKENAIWTKAVEFAKDSLTKEEYEAAMAALLEGKAIDENTKKKIGSIIGDKAKILSLKGIKEAALGAAAGIKTATTAFFSSPIGWIVLAVTAAIAAIAAIIHLVNAYTVTEEEAFSNAKKRAEELTNALEDTKKAYQDLKTNIENYKNARDGLDELTEGTTEWKEALADANSQALALLQTYPELAKYVNKNEKGLITIDEEGLAELADKQLDQIYKAQSAALIGNAVMRDAKSNLDTTKNAKSFDVDKKTLDAILALDSETILNPDKFANSLKSADIDIKDEKLIESLNDNREEIFALKQTVENTNNLLAIENGEIVSGFLQRYGYGSDSGILGGIITSNIMAEGTQKEDIDKLKSNIGISKGSFEAWAYAMGIEADEGSFKNDAWNAQVKYTVDGEQKTISYDQLKKELANWQYYYQNTQQYLSTATKLLEQVGKTTTKETNDIIRSVFASNQAATKDSIEDFTYSTVDDIDKVLTEQAEILTEGQIILLKETRDNIKTSFKNMGRERLWFDLDLTDNVQPIQDALVKLFGAADWDGLINDPTTEYSLLSGFGDALSRIRMMEGESGLDAITKFFNKFTNPTEFIKKINWTSETLWADIAYEMRKLGMEIDYTDTVIASAVQYFSQLNGALETSAERATKTKAIINGLDYGSIIKQEDYEYLFKTYGSWINEYFTQMEDGTAILTTSAWGFYDAYTAVDQLRRKNKLDSLIDQYGDFGELKGSYLDNSKITTENYFESREQAREDYWNNVRTSLTLEGVTNSWNTWNAIGSMGQRLQLNEASSIALLKSYFKAGHGVDIYKKLQDKYGGDLESWDDETWKKIVAENGSARWNDIDGDYIPIKTGEVINSRVYLTDALNAVIGHQIDSNPNLQDISYPYHNGNDLQKLVNDAISAGYIDTSTEEYKTLKAILDKKDNASTDVDYRIGSDGSSTALNAYYAAIRATQGSLKEIEAEALGLFSSVTSDTELQGLITQYESSLKPLLGDEAWNKLIAQGTEVANIAINDAEIKKYETSISNIDEAYNNLGQTIEALEKQLDKAFGKERIEILEDMNDALNRQNALLETQKQLAQAEATRRFQDSEGVVQDALKFIAKGEEISYGALLMRGGIADGTLDTTEEYETLIASLIETNATGEYTDAINTIITSLGPLFDQVYGYSNSIEENLAKEKENALAIFDYTYQTAHDFNEVKKAYNDFLREFSTEEDDFSAQATLAKDDYLTAYDDLIQSKQKVAALKNLSYNAEKQGYELNGQILTQAEYEAELVKEQEKYQEYALTLKEKLQELQDIEVQQIEEIAEQYSTITDSIESINELLEHQISIQSLLKGENSQEVLDLYEQQNTNLNSILTTQKEAYAYWENQVKNGGLTGEALDEAKAKWAEAGQAVAATSAELAQSYSDQFARIVQSSVDAVFNGLEELKEQYDWISSQSEKTFDSLSGAMEIQKAATAWTKAMYDSKNLKAQSQMNTFIEEEVALLKEKDKLTQYDLDRAQARFDLLQAQIALEEAQANKTSMRLVRGADGTYGYQYVADSSEIMEKQQAVNDAAQAVMDLDKEEIKTNLDEIYDTTTEFIDKYIAAWEDDFKIDEIERETLQSIWDSLMAEVGDTDDLVKNLRESMQEAAKAAGLEDYAELSDDEMKALFPELDTRYYETLKTLASTGFTQEKFNELLAVGNTEDAKAILTALTGLDLTSYIGDKDSGMTWLYQGMSKEAADSLVESKTSLDNIKTAVDECQGSFDLLEKSILAVAASLQSLSLGRFDIAIDSSGVSTDKNRQPSSKATVASMDTGGYTGEWGSWGKRAILHEKELVLNKVDTQNILQSVSIVRDISGYINALSAALDGNLGRTTVTTTEQNQPVQNVEIHAEFPNATDKNSIKEAFEEILAEAEQMLYENTR